MFRRWPSIQIPPEQEKTFVSPTTEVKIPKAQWLQIVSASALIILALVIDVLLVGPKLGGVTICAVLVFLCGRAAYRTQSKRRRAIGITLVIALVFTGCVWWFAGSRWLRPFWPVPQCYIDTVIPVGLETPQQWFICDGFGMFRVRGWLSRIWYILQWARWILFACSFPFIGFTALYVGALSYDLMTKNDNRRPGEHHSPYWWQFLFSGLMRKAVVEAFLKSVQVDKRSLEKIFRTQFYVPNGDAGYKKYDLDLTDDEWRNLRSLAIRDGAFSEAGLTEVGFSSGPHGSAREISEKLKEAQVIKKQGRSIVAISKFKLWLAEYGWRK